MAAISFKRPSANANTATSAVQTQAPAAVQQPVRQAPPAFVPPVEQVQQQVAQTPAPAAVQQPAPAPVTTAPAVVNSSSQALTVQGDFLPSVPVGSGELGGFEGQWSARDMAVPYLSIFQKQSKDFDDNMDRLGQWIFDKDFPLGMDITVVFLKANKYYVEKLPYGDPKIPERFSKIEDARAAGFGPDKLVDVADLDLLIELDAAIEGITDIASVVVEGKAYLMARYTVRSTSFKVARVLMKDAAGWLKGNLLNGKYTLSSGKTTNGENTWYAPSLKTGGYTSPALRSEILELLGVNQAAA